MSRPAIALVHRLLRVRRILPPPPPTGELSQLPAIPRRRRPEPELAPEVQSQLRSSATETFWEYVKRQSGRPYNPRRSPSMRARPSPERELLAVSAQQQML